jgi:hypothetical protein
MAERDTVAEANSLITEANEITQVYKSIKQDGETIELIGAKMFSVRFGGPVFTETMTAEVLVALATRFAVIDARLVELGYPPMNPPATL